MATLLYRLGRWCADHVRIVIVAWVVALLGIGAAAATFGKPVTNEVSIPGSNFQQVIDRLGEEIPDAAGGFATVVIRNTDGPIDAAQQDAIHGVFDQWTELDGVVRVVDPFAAQTELDSSAAQLSEGRTELEASEPQLRDAQEQLKAARAQLDQGKSFISAMETANPADPALAPLREQVADGERQYAEGLAQFESGEEQYREGLTRLDQGDAVVAAMDGMRTVSQDGSTAVVQIQFDKNLHSVDPEVRAQIPTIGDSLSSAGLTVDYSMEITQDTSLVGIGEVLGLALAAIVLVIVLGSLIAAGLPLLVALFGVGVGVAGAVALTVFYEMNSMTPALALMLGLAVGIDYTLFIVNRHRGQLLHGMPVKESIGRAVGTSGNAVFFAGSTVVIALAALVLSGIPMLAQMGLVAAGTVAVAVAVSLTLSPAVLAAMGTRVVSKRAWRAAGFAAPADAATRTVPKGDPDEEHGGWYVNLMTRRPWLTVLGVLGIVAFLAYPALDLRLGLPGGGNEPANSTAYKAYSAIEDNFGAGMNGPVLVMADLPGEQTEESATATQAQLATSLKGIPGVAHVVPFGMSADHSTIAFQVVPTTGPADAETVETVHALLASAPAIEMTSGATLGLTGQTVANIEISERLGAALPGYLLVVVGLSLIILTGVFRSLVVPVVATAGFLLSIAVAFGTTVAVYQWGWLGPVFGVHQPGPVLSFMPIMLIGVLFGLAMDYQMFLVSGMREAWSHGEDARKAVKSGFVHGAKVVTAAAIIMFAVFGGFVFSHLTMVRPMGFGLAVGVLVDAVLIRMTLTPAVMHILGERAWGLPRWLDRLLPNFDVEGASLTERLGRAETSAASEATVTSAEPELVTAR